MTCNSIVRVGAMLLLLGSGIASGQGIATAVRAARIFRPSDEGPSSTIGDVGGAYTRYSTPERTQSQMRFNSQSAAIGPSARGFQGAGSVKQTGLYAGPAPDVFGRRALRSGGVLYGAKTSPFDMGDVMWASGLDEATSYELPLIGWESPRITSSGTAIYIAPSDATVFHNFFGLTPKHDAPPPPPVAEAENPPLLQSELIGRINDRETNELIEQGKREFALGTTIGRSDRGERLARAAGQFTSARRLDPKGWLPALLFASVSLEQDRVETALQALEEAVTRNARALAERPDIASLYGSRELFDATARKFFQIGTHASGESKSVLLEAYLALLSGDKGRAEAALRRSEEANRMLGVESLDRITRSIRVALQ